MSIWGWKSTRRRIGSGLFLCPAESTERAYWLFRMRTWLTVFSVPVLPVKVTGEQVECFCCGNTYKPGSAVAAGARGLPLT